MTEHKSAEYDCQECGRHIVDIVHNVTTPICALCKTLPGWFKVPELKRILDPE